MKVGIMVGGGTFTLTGLKRVELILTFCICLNILTIGM